MQIDADHVMAMNGESVRRPILQLLKPYIGMHRILDAKWFKSNQRLVRIMALSPFVSSLTANTKWGNQIVWIVFKWNVANEKNNI